MSQKNVEWARQLGAAWGRNDQAAVEALFEGHVADDFEAEPLNLEQVYKGFDGVRQARADMLEVWADYRSELEEVVDLGEHVLLLTRVTGRAAGGGVPVDRRFAVLIRFRGEKLVWAKSFASEAEALEAVGLSE